MTRDLLAKPVLVAVWLVALPAAFAGAINALTPLRLDELGVSGTVIGAIFLAAAAIEGVITPLVGRVLDRRGRSRPPATGSPPQSARESSCRLPAPPHWWRRE